MTSHTDKAVNFYTVKELATEWRVCVETIRRYIRAGRIEVVYVGGYLISREAAAAAAAAITKRKLRR